MPDAVQSIITHTIFNSFTTNLSVCMWRHYTIWCFKNICFEIIKMTLAASRSFIGFPLLGCIMLYLSAHTNICLVLTDQTSFLWTVLFSLIYKICLFYTFVHTLITTVFNNYVVMLRRNALWLTAYYFLKDDFIDFEDCLIVLCWFASIMLWYQVRKLMDEGYTISLSCKESLLNLVVIKT